MTEKELRECICMVLERLGLDRPADAYLDDVVALQRAAVEWSREHKEQHGALELHLPSAALSGVAIVTGDLCNAIPMGWAANAAARHFIDFIDERTGRRCTLLMLQVLVILQDAAAPAVNASGGRA